MALDNVRSNKFRSFLTVLGIVIGVMAAIVVASILTGMRQSIISIIEEYGTNNIYAFHLTTGPRTSTDRAERLAQAFNQWRTPTRSKRKPVHVEDLAVIAPNVGYNGGPFDDNITYQGKNYRWGNTQGVTPNYAGIVNINLREGRFITESDEEQRRNVMVIGVNAADALFPGQQNNIVGTEVRMGGLNFEIVGVLEKRKAGFFGENEEDNAVLIPFRTAQKVAPARGWILFIIQARSGQLNEALTQSEDILASSSEREVRRSKQLRYQDGGQLRQAVRQHLCDGWFGGDCDLEPGPAGRRDWRDEYHAGERDRANSGNWHSQSAGRAAPRHHQPVSV